MNETFLEAMQRKGWVQAQDGSWSRPKRGSVGAVGLPVQEPDRVKGAQGVQLAPNRTPKRIRQSRDKMNALELEYYGLLKGSMAFAFSEKNHITAQSLRFKLANGIWYKPDFVAFATEGVFAYEVKGPHAFRGGFENLKVAASQYPWIKWALVWKENGQWQEQEVLP